MWGNYCTPTLPVFMIIILSFLPEDLSISPPGKGTDAEKCGHMTKNAGKIGKNAGKIRYFRLILGNSQLSNDSNHIYGFFDPRLGVLARIPGSDPDLVNRYSDKLYPNSWLSIYIYTSNKRDFTISLLCNWSIACESLDHCSGFKSLHI